MAIFQLQRYLCSGVLQIFIFYDIQYISRINWYVQQNREVVIIYVLLQLIFVNCHTLSMMSWHNCISEIQYIVYELGIGVIQFLGQAKTAPHLWMAVQLCERSQRLVLVYNIQNAFARQSCENTSLQLLRYSLLDSFWYCSHSYKWWCRNTADGL